MNPQSSPNLPNRFCLMAALTLSLAVYHSALTSSPAAAQPYNSAQASDLLPLDFIELPPGEEPNSWMILGLGGSQGGDDSALVFPFQWQADPLHQLGQFEFGVGPKDCKLENQLSVCVFHP